MDKIYCEGESLMDNTITNTSRWVICPNCGYEFHCNELSYDELGWHTTCPDCEGTFDVDLG